MTHRKKTQRYVRVETTYHHENWRWGEHRNDRDFTNVSKKRYVFSTCDIFTYHMYIYIYIYYIHIIFMLYSYCIHIIFMLYLYYHMLHVSCITCYMYRYTYCFLGMGFFNSFFSVVFFDGRCSITFLKQIIRVSSGVMITTIGDHFPTGRDITTHIIFFFFFLSKKSKKLSPFRTPSPHLPRWVPSV